MKLLQVSIVVCLAAFASADVIADEDFESGVLPTGWQVWQEGDPGATEWAVCAVGDSLFMPDPAHSGTHYAWHDDNGISYSDSWLVTETYDLSTYDSVLLTFWRYAKYPGYYNYSGFYYSTDPSPGSSVDFTELLELGPDNFDLWWEFGIDVTTQCAGQSSVTFAWVYRGEYAQAEAIDDFYIEASTLSLDQSTWGAIKTTF
ncbi:hypothetical protein DRQ25_17330 [Candidatus Fermentibacteria bacterium]|nr:MAG: hypothetical protein DRQ25_17330 [Candidatus Fermentibacteria bacterium]